MIKLDPLHHRLEINSISLELQPLSFDLFAKLFEHAGNIVSVKRLTHEVWDGVVVTPDTLKQRVFLLRKSLEDSGADPKMIQSVRGKGYRLIIPAEKPSTSQFIKHKKYFILTGLLLAGLMAGISYRWVNNSYELPANNRMAFWARSSLQSVESLQKERQQSWVTLLASNENFAYVSISWEPGQTLSRQARQARVALISFWDIYETGGLTLTRIQIIEPKTATVLRSDVVDLQDNELFKQTLTSNMAALERLVQSGILPLPGDAINDTDHSDWEKLRRLAASP